MPTNNTNKPDAATSQKLAAIPDETDETRPAVTPADGDRGFLTTRELQKAVLPLSRRSIFEWRKKGIIPSIQVGSKIYWHRESVIAALLRRQRGGFSEN
jgi:hypothetical protein